MIKSVSANDNQLAEEIKYEFKQTDQSAKTADLWNEAVQSRTGRLHGDNSALGGRGGSDIAVGLSDNTSSSDTARDTERERVAYRTEEEYDEIVKKVREMYGLDTILFILFF